MTQFFASGRVADVILAVLAIEAVLLLRGRRLPTADLLLLLGAGAAFAWALRGALTGAAWPWVALPLAVAGLLHGWDLRRRLRRDATANATTKSSRLR